MVLLIHPGDPRIREQFGTGIDPDGRAANVSALEKMMDLLRLWF